MMSDIRRRAKRGEGSLRSRRPGTWEIRVTIGSPTGPGRQRSFTHRGDEDSARRRKAELIQLYGARHTTRLDRVPTTVGTLLESFLQAPQAWSRSTRRTYEGQAAVLRTDPVLRVPLARWNPAATQRTFERWMREDVTPANLNGRHSLLHAAIEWGIAHRIVQDNPLAEIAGPSQPPPRQHLRPGEVRRLIRTADELVAQAGAVLAARPNQRGAALRLYRAEQDALLVRVEADVGLSRGELSALHTIDKQGRVLSIKRTSQDGVIVEVKEHRRTSLTVSQGTTRYWAQHVRRWHGTTGRESWLFMSTPEAQRPVLPNGLGQRFEKLAHAAGLPGAALHRIRHTIGMHLVSQGKIVQASKRLRHRDVATTLRTYQHALPLDDVDVADTLAQLHGLDDGTPN